MADEPGLGAEPALGVLLAVGEAAFLGLTTDAESGSIFGTDRGGG